MKITTSTTPLLPEATAQQLEADLTALVQQEKATLGVADANYLLKLVQWQRFFAISGRLLMLGCFWSAWFLVALMAYDNISLGSDGNIDN